jgi:hypothetical protein
VHVVETIETTCETPAAAGARGRVDASAFRLKAVTVPVTVRMAADVAMSRGFGLLVIRDARDLPNGGTSNVSTQSNRKVNGRNYFL